MGDIATDYSVGVDWLRERERERDNYINIYIYIYIYYKWSYNVGWESVIYPFKKTVINFIFFLLIYVCVFK